MRTDKRCLGGIAAAFSLAALIVTPATTFAGETPPEVFEEGVKKEANKKENESNPGWHVQLDLGASVSLSGNDNVVGQPDGLSWTLGANVGVAGGYRKGPHDWLNKLGIQLQFSNTPPLEEFIKSTDLFEFRSTYYYRALDWVGPFVRFSLKTQLLPGEDVQANDVTYTLNKLDGTTEDSTASTFALTDAFSPITLKQSLGAFFRPYWETVAKVEFRVGLAAQQIIADGQTAVNTGLTEGVVLIDELADGNQVGAELGFEVAGAFEGNKILYSVYAETLLPFYSDGPNATDKSFGDLINVEFGAKLAFKLVDWVSLSYEFKALRQPQLLDEWQISNQLLLTLGYSNKWVEEEPPKDDKPAAK